MKRRVLLLIFSFVILGCVNRQSFFISKNRAFELGVAPFSGEFSHDLLESLNKLVDRELKRRGWSGYKSYIVVRQCEEILLSKGMYLKGLRKWSSVGKCVPVRYLLVPYLKNWRERKGSKWGVIQPAMVEFFLYVFDVKKQKVVEVFHFRQEQKPLSENLLEIKKFLKRKGWISTRKLFKEGLLNGFKELGL